MFPHCENPPANYIRRREVMSTKAGLVVYPDADVGARIGRLPWTGPDLDGIGDGTIWGTDEEEYALNLMDELFNGPGDTPRLFKVAHELRELRNELYVRSIGREDYNSYLQDCPRGFWNTRRVLDGFARLDEAFLALIADLDAQKIQREEFRIGLRKALDDHHNRTGVFQWPAYDEEEAARYHHGVFSGGNEYMQELRKGHILCSPSYKAVPFGLRSSSTVYLKQLSPDWVAPPEGQYGADATMSGADQIAGLPNPEGCFPMDMDHGQIGQSASGDV